MRPVFSRACPQLLDQGLPHRLDRLSIKLHGTSIVDLDEDEIVLELIERSRSALGDGAGRRLGRWLGDLERFVQYGGRGDHEEEHELERHVDHRGEVELLDSSASRSVRVKTLPLVILAGHDASIAIARADDWQGHVTRSAVGPRVQVEILFRAFPPIGVGGPGIVLGLAGQTLAGISGRPVRHGRSCLRLGAGLGLKIVKLALVGENLHVVLVLA